MTPTEIAGTIQRLEPAHRSDPLLQMLVVPFSPLFGLDEAGREGTHLVVDSTWIDGNPTLGEPLNDIHIELHPRGTREPRIPPHGGSDHLVREAVPTERRG